MLSILGQKSAAYCDGHSRRHFLKIGGLAMGGLALPQVLKAQAAAGSLSSSTRSHKAVIMIYLSGGPSHQDMYDLKMNAPAEIRGSFRPIPTNVPGIEICEHMPRLAKMMDKFTIIRSLYGSPDQHNSDMCLSGYPNGPRGKQDGHPSLGSVLSKLQGPIDPAIPPSIGLTIKTKHLPYSNPGSPGFLGMAHSPFLPDGPEMTEMRLHGVTLDRLRDRRALLASYDAFRRRTERQATSQGLDAFTQAAFEVLTSSKLAEALDLEREDPRTPRSLRTRQCRSRLRRGRRPPLDGPVPAGPAPGRSRRPLRHPLLRQLGPARRQFHPAPPTTRQVRPGDHRSGRRFACSRLGPGCQCHRLGRIRPHPTHQQIRRPRPLAQGVLRLLAGGGMRMGQVIGSTNRLGEEPQDRPVHYQDVFATLYHQLGIDVQNTMIYDATDRPHFLLDRRDPIRELI